MLHKLASYAWNGGSEAVSCIFKKSNIMAGQGLSFNPWAPFQPIVNETKQDLICILSWIVFFSNESHLRLLLLLLRLPSINLHRRGKIRPGPVSILLHGGRNNRKMSSSKVLEQAPPPLGSSEEGSALTSQVRIGYDWYETKGPIRLSTKSTFDYFSWNRFVSLLMRLHCWPKNSWPHVW